MLHERAQESGSTAAAATLLDVMTLGSSRSAEFLERASGVLFLTILTVAAAQVSVPLPFTPVPCTLQPMVVLLGGAALGARLGASSQAVDLTLGLAGLS